MTSAPLPLGERLGRSDPDTPPPALELQALREECDALRTQLGDLQQRCEKLSLRLRQWEEGPAPPGVAPASPPAAGEPGVDPVLPGVEGEEPPALRDLIAAMIRGADGPPPSPSTAPKALAPRDECPLRRGLARLLRWPRTLGWLAALALALLLAAVALRFVF